MSTSRPKQHDNWNTFWADKRSPKWAQHDAEYYRRYAGELRLLYQDRQPTRVLELGCGSGSLYPFLGFEGARYKGVDFSSSMLTAFHDAYPSLELVQASGESYRDDQTYDLILSNGLVQYFDPAMLNQHLSNARAMLAKNGILVCGSVPWLARRSGYCRAAFAERKPRNPLLGLLVLCKYMATKDPVGEWYSLRAFRQMAVRHGMRVGFHGSGVHLYRFHATFTVA